MKLLKDAIGCTQVAEFLYEINAVFAPVAKSISVYPNLTNGDIIMHINATSIEKIEQLQIFNIQGVAMEFDHQSCPMKIFQLIYIICRRGKYFACAH